MTDQHNADVNADESMTRPASELTHVPQQEVSAVAGALVDFQKRPGLQEMAATRP